MGCNGTRLCRLLVPVATKLTNDRTLIVPVASIGPLIKLLKKSSGPVTLRRSRTLFEAATTDFSFVSKLIDAAYVSYENLIPKERALPNSVTLDRAELAAVLARMAAVADPAIAFPLAGLEWEPGADMLKLSLVKQSDAATELLEAEITGACRIAFALPKLLELAEELKGERLCIATNGVGAARITIPGNNQITVLQMPTTWQFNEQRTVAA